jgi:3-dehydroquinate synthase/shikimate kinase/3-dehydroquinate synthase
MVAGYAEILKHALISNRNFFSWLSKNGIKIINKKNNFILKKAIIKSCKIKSEIVNKDEKEKNLRMILNFGHTFAHAFERTKNFSKKLNHGEAVLLGMMIASEFSYKKKLLSLEDLSLIKKHYLSLKLTKNINRIFKKNEIKKIIYFMKKDKKNYDEKINLILLKKIGMPTKPGKIALKSTEIKEFLFSYYN